MLATTTSRLRRLLTTPSKNLHRLHVHELRHLSQISPTVIPQTRSIVAGPLDPPLSELTLPSYFKSQILPHHASRPALISRHEQNIRWTFAEFDAQIERMARGLLDAGVKPGDRVATVLGNCSAYAVLQWACARIGAIIVTTNPAYKTHEILGALNKVGASTLILSPTLRKSELLRSIAGALPTLGSTLPGQDINDPELASLRRLFVVDNTEDRSQFQAELGRIPCAVDLAEVANAQYGPEPADTAANLQNRPLDHHDVANLQFTSGTTGLPKAASVQSQTRWRTLLHTHLFPKDICALASLFKDAGNVLGNLAAWVHGAAIVYASESFDPKAIVRAVEEERCTGLHGVPTHFIGVLEELDRLGPGADVKMNSLRTGIAAGSPIPIELMRKLITRLNLRELTIAYGMTETSPVSFQTTPDDRLEMRVESVGRIQPHVRAKVIDEHGSIVPVGVPGELCVSGYLLQKGYWEDPEQTASVMRRDHDGMLWMHTGDQVVIDQEGYLKITGRIKDLIIRGGEVPYRNLSPIQIENCITSHPDVLEAAAIAIPDERFGEVVGLWIVLRPDAISLTRKDIVDWVKGRMNPQVRVVHQRWELNAPSYVWFIGEHGAPTELPKTGSGKVQKNILREWARVYLTRGDIAIR
ncbi:hypothetical protein CTheo_3287 [Ceratobasidium theobromae]|uniref:Uncharacterized protein n=1 Tax=Ceratobasidium theobromae TaxID=1582974 RepID=A0A5N5QNM5_9AGAM|nr:hypothetical protein CTheo_3287 [Ceratobasidium theobromae]